MFNPSTSMPMYMQIYGQLQSQILGGKLQVGDKLPSEKELGLIYNASRITIRQALERLIKDDLIVTVQGKGAYVKRPMLRVDLMQVTSFSASIKERGLIATTRLIAYEADATDVTGKFLGAGHGGVSALELVGLIQGKPAVHYRSIIRKDIAERIYPLALRHEELKKAFSTFSLYEEIGCRIHQVSQEIFAEAACASLAFALDIPPGAPLLKMESLAADAAGHPIEYKLAHYRADKYSFSLVRKTAMDGAG